MTPPRRWYATPVGEEQPWPGVEPAAIDAAIGRVFPTVTSRLRRLGIDAPMGRMIAEVYAPLACWITERHGHGAGPLVVGVHGAQGSGKSTLAQVLTELLPELSGLRAASFSLDDIYLGRAERETLGHEVHPLLRVRGVPGTHDVSLGLSLLDALRNADDDARIRIPSFDKATDERRPPEDWPEWQGRCDVILFEGWCLGVPAEEPGALSTPINALEAEEDPQGFWRRYVNAQLRDRYADLWAQIDALVMLAVPSMEQVVQWRTLQERKLAAARAREGLTGGTGLMDEAGVARFVMFFERLTRHALKVLPKDADVTIRLGADQQPRAVEASPP